MNRFVRSRDVSARSVPVRIFLPAMVGLTMSASGADAQTFRGRVTDQGSGEPVVTALVKLVDEAGKERAITIADSAGLYRLEADEPGIFRLVAERIGFRPFETPLLEVGLPEGVYPIDIEMAPAPVELRGFTVMTDRVPEEQVDRTVQLITGLHPNSLRFRPLGFDALQDHAVRAHSIVDVVRWEYGPSLIVYETPDGPCMQFRNRNCLPVFLNGLGITRDFIEGVPLDMLYRVQVILPTDGSVVYPTGAVLMYTEAWLR